MKKVLIVSFYFPPTNSVAAVRLGKFAKYLPQFGWEPIVLTADTAKDRPQTLPVEIDQTNVFRTSYFALYSSLYRDLKGSQETASEAAPRKFNWREPIYRAVRLAQPVYTLSILAPLLTDPIGWYPHAVKKGRELLNKHKIDVIFSSYAPSTSHLVASRLHRVSGIPWIAEFRDLWALNHNARTTRFLRFFEECFEKKVMKHSSSLIVCSEGMVEQLERLHRKRVVTINNGFDEEDYAENVPQTSKFTITYTGNIYGGKQDPNPLLQALKELKEAGKVLPGDFELRFFGGSSLAAILPLIERHDLTGLVKVYDLIPFKECIAMQKESTVLLFLKWNDPSAKGIYSGKLFEYLGAKRPVMAVGTFKDELVDTLISESGTGVLLNNATEIVSVLSCWLEEWRQTKGTISYWKPNMNVIGRYTRRGQAEKLAGLLEEVSQP